MGNGSKFAHKNVQSTSTTQESRGAIMLINGILNPQINSLLARVRHTNMLVIADRGFPFWPMIETVDISLVSDIPTVLQVFQAIRQNFELNEIFMAQEFLEVNLPDVKETFKRSTAPIPISFELHTRLKERVPNAIGLIRTGDTIQYANMILVSGPILLREKQ
jgi:D-ribose pyranase